MNYLAAPLRRDLRYAPTSYGELNPCLPLAGLSAFGGLNALL